MKQVGDVIVVINPRLKKKVKLARPKKTNCPTTHVKMVAGKQINKTFQSSTITENNKNLHFSKLS